MPKETKHVPLGLSLIGFEVTQMISLAIMYRYVSYAVTAETCYLQDLKNGANRNQ